MKTLNSPLVIFTLTLTLVIVGIVAIYSASGAVNSTLYLRKQIFFASIGMIGLLVAYRIDYNKLRKISPLLMLLGLGGCLLVFAPGIGWSSHKATRWIRVAGMQLQPSEFAKLALIVYMAKMLADRHQYIKSFFSGVMPAMIVTGLFAFVIVLEPDFGAALVLCTIVFGMWLVAGMRWFHLLGLTSCAGGAGVFAVLLEPYRLLRVQSYLTYLFHPESISTKMLREEFWQVTQSLVAVGSGGWWGLGLGESRQKFQYLPEAHTDFVFAIICEEMGFVRASAVLLLFLLLVFMGWRVAWRTTDLFGSLLATGITLMIFINIAINISVVLGLLPAKGLVLPFVSAGGSALIVSMTAIGILMNIARNEYAHDAHGRYRRK